MSQVGYGRVSAEEPLDFTWKGVNRYGINVGGSKTMDPDKLARFIVSRFKRRWRELVMYRDGTEVLRVTRHPEKSS